MELQWEGSLHTSMQSYGIHRRGHRIPVKTDRDATCLNEGMNVLLSDVYICSESTVKVSAK